MTKEGEQFERLADLITLCAATLRIMSRSIAEKQAAYQMITFARDLDDIADELRDILPQGLKTTHGHIPEKN